MKIQPIKSNITFKGQPIIRHSQPVFKGHPYPFNECPTVLPEEEKTKIDYKAESTERLIF